MEIRPVVLRQELMKALAMVENQISEVDREARRLGTDSQLLRNPNGSWVLIPLIVAKAQLLSSLTLLNEKGKKGT